MSLYSNELPCIQKGVYFRVLYSFVWKMNGRQFLFLNVTVLGSPSSECVVPMYIVNEVDESAQYDCDHVL